MNYISQQETLQELARRTLPIKKTLNYVRFKDKFCENLDLEGVIKAQMCR